MFIMTVEFVAIGESVLLRNLSGGGVKAHIGGGIE
jgi:hypothetical protein